MAQCVEAIRTDLHVRSMLKEAAINKRLNMIYCGVLICFISTLVNGLPKVELMEEISSNFCGANFHLSGKDYTLLKYKVTGPNSTFTIGQFTSPTIVKQRSKSH
ncbi:hypothetical protein ElyMa_005763300, partial [Elysia marginata]